MNAINEKITSFREWSLAEMSCMIAIVFTNAIQNWATKKDLRQVYADLTEKFHRTGALHN